MIAKRNDMNMVLFLLLFLFLLSILLACLLVLLYSFVRLFERECHLSFFFFIFRFWKLVHLSSYMIAAVFLFLWFCGCFVCIWLYGYPRSYLVD